MKTSILSAALALLAIVSNAGAQSYPPNIAAVNPTTLITINSATSAEETRTGLREKIFGSDALNPSLAPAYVATYNHNGDAGWAGKPNLASIQIWDVTTSYGVKSRTWRFSPATFRKPTAGKCGFILHGGHGHVSHQPPFKDLLLSLVAAGCEVATIDMPLNGHNAGSVTIDTPQGRISPTNHDHLMSIQTPGFHPLRLFLEPSVAIVNDFASRGITNIGMAGLSGGGWSTDVYAALDPRVKLSVSIAGSMPIYMRSWVPPATNASMGDYEQLAIPALGVDYMDIYLLAGFGPGRHHANMYIVNDSCCFGGYNANHFAPAVSAVAATIGASFAVAFDTTVNVHTISAFAANYVVGLSMLWL